MAASVINGKLEQCYRNAQHDQDLLIRDGDTKDTPDKIKEVSTLLKDNLQAMKDIVKQSDNAELWKQRIENTAINGLVALQKIADSALNKIGTDQSDTEDTDKLKERVQRVTKAHDGMVKLTRVLRDAREGWKGNIEQLKNRGIELFNRFARENLDKIEGTARNNRKKDAELKKSHLKSRIKKLRKRINRVSPLIKGSLHLAQSDGGLRGQARLEQARRDLEALQLLRQRAEEDEQATSNFD